MSRCYPYLKTAAIIFAMLGGTAFAAQEPDWPTPATGGGGGAAASARCPAGTYLIGLQARIGDDIDAIGPICAQPLTTGEIVGVSRPQAFGGAGGTAREAICPQSAPFVRSMFVSAEGDDTVVLNGVVITCGPLTGPLPRAVDGYNRLALNGPTYRPSQGLFVTDGAKSASGTAECPSHMAPAGVHGRAGAMVDALGLICGGAAATRPKALGKVGSAEPVSAAAASIDAVRTESVQLPAAKRLGKVRSNPPAAEDPVVCQRARSARGKVNPTTQAALDTQCRNAGGTP